MVMPDISNFYAADVNVKKGYWSILKISCIIWGLSSLTALYCFRACILKIPVFFTLPRKAVRWANLQTLYRYSSIINYIINIYIVYFLTHMFCAHFSMIYVQFTGQYISVSQYTFGRNVTID